MAISIRRTTVAYLAALAALALTLVACGPPDGGADADGGTDAADTHESNDTSADTYEPDTGVDTTSDAEADSGMDADDGGDTGDPEFVLAVSTTNNAASPTTSTVRTVVDYSTGSVAKKKTYRSDDLVLDESAGRLFVLDRKCSREKDRCSRAADRVIGFSVGADGSFGDRRELGLPGGAYNPQGVGVAAGGSRTFVTSYTSSEVFEYDASGGMVDRLDLSPFDAGATADDDDPEASDVVVEEGHVYFTLLRLSGFMANENSALAGYDLSSNAFLDFDDSTSGTQALDLQGKNGYTGVHRKPDGTWTIGLVGSATKVDGKIVALTEESDGTFGVGAEVATESQLGGKLQNYVWTSSTTGVAALLKGGKTRYVTFDVGGGNVQTTQLESFEGFSSALCMSPDRSQVWVGVAPSSASTTEFVGYDPATRTELSASGPEVTGGLPSCEVLTASN